MSTSTLSRLSTRTGAACALVLLTVMGAPARADVPEGWSDPAGVDGWHMVALLVGAPLGLALLITLAVWLPAFAKGVGAVTDDDATTDAAELEAKRVNA